MPFTVHVTLSLCWRERRQILSLQDVAVQFARFESGGLQHLGILQGRVYRSRIHDVKELKERLLREWRLLDYTIITAAISRLNACVRVNGGHF